MNKTIYISDFSFDDENIRKISEHLFESLRKHSRRYIMRIDIHLPQSLDPEKISTFSQKFAEKQDESCVIPPPP